MAKKVWDVLSPDGIAIHPENIYETEGQAVNAFHEWKRRYVKQGYYSTAGKRIPLDELFQACKIVEIEIGENHDKQLD